MEKRIAEIGYLVGHRSLPTPTALVLFSKANDVGSSRQQTPGPSYCKKFRHLFYSEKVDQTLTRDIVEGPRTIEGWQTGDIIPPTISDHVCGSGFNKILSRGLWASSASYAVIEEDFSTSAQSPSRRSKNSSKALLKVISNFIGLEDLGLE